MTKTKRAYLEGTREQLESWGEHLERFEKALRERADDARADLRDRIDRLQRQRRELRERLDGAGSKLAEGWSEVRDDLEAAVADFRREAGEVYDALRK